MSIQYIINIPLSGRAGRDKYAKIDCDYAHEICELQWYFNKTTGYVFTNIDSKTVYLHRFIMGKYSTSTDDIDHIDQNKLNNCRSNLQFTSKSNNQFNRKCRNRTTGVPGIDTMPNGKYKVSIRKDYTYYYFGVFRDWDEALQTRISAERMLFPQPNNVNIAYSGIEIPDRVEINTRLLILKTNKAYLSLK